MSMRGLGVLLVWAGAVLLVAVLQNRIRKGAWKELAFDEPPPLEKWVAPAAALGMVLAAIGAGLAMWSFL